VWVKKIWKTHAKGQKDRPHRLNAKIWHVENEEKNNKFPPAIKNVEMKIVKV